MTKNKDTIIYANLSEGLFDRLVKTHDEAFADYHVDLSYMTADALRKRMLKNNVSMDTSVGAFAGERLVGFTLIGVDNWLGKPAAFDAGTGIIPAYRGMGIARGMFEFSLPPLKKKGIDKFLLEVLKPNEAAIKAYTKTGFKVTRELDCFDLDLQKVKKNEIASPFPIKPIAIDQLMTFKDMTDWQPSWENSFSALQNIAGGLVSYGAFDKDLCVGVIAYYPTLNWIMSILVKEDYRKQGIGRSLVNHMLGVFNEKYPALSKVKLNNVDHSDRAMLKFLEETGFDFVIGQYEMDYDF